MFFKHWYRVKALPLKNPEQAALVANMLISDALISKLCPKGGTFVDVGAHLGMVFSTARHNDSSMKVVAFEADPDKVSFISGKFPYATVHGVAVGERSGEATFYIDGSSTAFNSLVEQSDRDQRKIVVPIVTLDDALDEHAPDIVKIDVEGAELGVLKGGKRTIETHLPTIMFESTGAGVNSMGYSASGVWDWFNQHDYGVFYPNRLAHDAPPLKLETFLDAHEYPMRTVNFFAVPNSRRIEVRDRARRILNI